MGVRAQELAIDQDGVLFYGQKAQFVINLISQTVISSLKFQIVTLETGDNITYPGTKLTADDISKFNSQYPNLTVDSSSKAFHDRFLILDEKAVYHVGASIKDAGKKCFGISQWKDQGSINDLLARVK